VKNTKSPGSCQDEEKKKRKSLRHPFQENSGKHEKGPPSSEERLGPKKGNDRRKGWGGLMAGGVSSRPALLWGEPYSELSLHREHG